VNGGAHDATACAGDAKLASFFTFISLSSMPYMIILVFALMLGVVASCILS
jgi:hypothetical protein